jgi:branched-subunit amino acid transport protein
MARKKTGKILLVACMVFFLAVCECRCELRVSPAWLVALLLRYALRAMLFALCQPALFLRQGKLTKSFAIS